MTSIVSIGFDRVVITGIGMTTAVGRSREAVWHAVQNGRSGVKRLTGVPGIPDGSILGATVETDDAARGTLKQTTLGLESAEEAIRDSGIRMDKVDRDRFGCYVSGIMADCSYFSEKHGRQEWLAPNRPAWHEQWFSTNTCSAIFSRFGLSGPTNSHSTACASGTIEFLSAYRAILDDQCDIAIAGAAEAIDPIFAAGFQNMRALATNDNPQEACKPFDRNRNGFVMGEGAGMLILESLSHARRRGATIYAEVLGGGVVCDAHHLTGVDKEGESLCAVIEQTLRRAKLDKSDIDYISAHGTATRQNDVAEARGIRRAFGSAADNIAVSSMKSMIGHLVNASGSVELALTALALRDGFTPPTINLTDQDPEIDIDCVPLVGRKRYAEHAMKFSLAFGGHMAAVALRRWDKLGEARGALPLYGDAAAA